jgi:hypothetical protein
VPRWIRSDLGMLVGDPRCLSCARRRLEVPKMRSRWLRYAMSKSEVTKICPE